MHHRQVVTPGMKDQDLRGPSVSCQNQQKGSTDEVTLHDEMSRERYVGRADVTQVCLRVREEANTHHHLLLSGKSQLFALNLNKLMRINL
ncbi:hypothetical protein FKM82_006596 [Ascaphus truei]